MKEFLGINMLFVDDSNFRVHGFASAKYCKHLFQGLIEGQIYIISNFKVKDFIGDETNRHVRKDKHIYFTPHTELMKDDGAGLKIEEYSFDLFYMGEIEKLADDNRFLIDMVGKVQNVQPTIKTIKSDAEKTRLHFEITDGRFSVKVTLFDDFGVTIEQLFKRVDENNIYIIICCAKVGRYEGAPNLTNYPATRIYINPDHYSVEELKDRFAENCDVQMVTANEDSPKIMLTVKEIKALQPDYDRSNVTCEVTVKKLDDKASWYYSKCTGCELEIYRENNKFRCPQCCRIIPYPDKRFRLCTICSDNTASIAIVFPDSEITRLIEKTVIDIQSDCVQEEDEEKFPTILYSILKQKYTITIEIKEDNLKNGSTVYDAIEIHEAVEICDSFDPTKNTTTAAQDVSVLKDKEEKQNINDTPQTRNSSNIKTKARKIVEPVHYDGTEHRIIKALKTIKQEKV